MARPRRLPTSVLLGLAGTLVAGAVPAAAAASDPAMDAEEQFEKEAPAPPPGQPAGSGDIESGAPPGDGGDLAPGEPDVTDSPEGPDLPDTPAPPPAPPASPPTPPASPPTPPPDQAPPVSKPRPVLPPPDTVPPPPHGLAPPPAPEASPRPPAESHSRRQDGQRTRAGRGVRREPIVRQAPAPPPPTVRAPAVSQATPAAAAPHQLRGVAPAADRSGGGRGVHRVRAGESLWSIASDQLGASASPARIAALVERLWKLNAGRIASGKPGVLRPGERLILP